MSQNPNDKISLQSLTTYAIPLEKADILTQPQTLSGSRQQIKVGWLKFQDITGARDGEVVAVTGRHDSIEIM